MHRHCDVSDHDRALLRVSQTTSTFVKGHVTDWLLLELLHERLVTAQAYSPLPIVDLGYALQQATLYNSTGKFYNFSNIRYAKPPVGGLRFAAPQPPDRNRSEVQTGDVGRICPQAGPAWTLVAQEFLMDYVLGIPFNSSSSPSSSPSSSSSSLFSDPRISEDCLFLDVVVPEKVYKNRKRGRKAPVLVWIYGGGYTAGSKSGSENPAGLIKRSQRDGDSGIIYVSMNYRHGAFGWLSGPTFQANGTANAGLWDQRFALEWVQKYIHLFGGDPGRVTVIGESAGGGSLMHQITAFGGKKGPVPFQQAILQSPGWVPITSSYQQEKTLNIFLSLLNVSTIEEARKLPSEALIRANILQVGASSYGSFTYGPAVDGNFVPALPGLLLLHGNFDHSVKVMVGHNADEGLYFTSPYITNNTAFRDYVDQSFPTVQPPVVEYITEVLYPPVFDGTHGYTSQIERTALTVSEFIFTCNTNYLDWAENNRTYAYIFTVPSAFHGQDLPYTYYNGARVSSSVRNVSVALALQDFITSFAQTGRPQGEQGIPKFVIYGANATVMNLNISSITQGIDPAANERCRWWQKALYD